MNRTVVSDKRLQLVEAAYVAGFFDGEGTLTIARESRKGNRSGVRYFACMMAANTDYAGLEHLQRLCGNGRIDCSVAAKGRNQKPVYRLWFSPNQARHVLPQIEPYLCIKRAQAAILMEFLDICASGKDANVAHWDTIERLRGQIRELNYRGATKVAYKAAKIFIRAKAPIVRTRRKRGVCQIDGCQRPHQSKGYCRRHYKLYVERGGPKRYEAVCEHCNTSFVSRYQARFCSKKCGDKSLVVRAKTPSP